MAVECPLVEKQWLRAEAHINLHLALSPTLPNQTVSLPLHRRNKKLGAAPGDSSHCLMSPGFTAS